MGTKLRCVPGVLNFRGDNVVDWMCSCSDYIAVHDGTDATKPLLQQFCADDRNRTVTSSGDRLYVQFVSDDQLEAQGFAASFRFIPRGRLTTSVVATPPTYTSGTQACRGYEISHLYPYP